MYCSGTSFGGSTRCRTAGDGWHVGWSVSALNEASDWDPRPHKSSDTLLDDAFAVARSWDNRGWDNEPFDIEPVQGRDGSDSASVLGRPYTPTGLGVSR